MSRSLDIPVGCPAGAAVLAPLFGIVLLAAGAPAAAQTEADILVRSNNPVGAFIEQNWPGGLPTVTVTTGTAEEEVLTATVSAGEVTVYSDGDVGFLNTGFDAGQLDQSLGRGFGGRVQASTTVLTAAVGSSPQVSASAQVTNGGVATVSAHTRVSSTAISTSRDDGD